jgi:hypothetical protein
LGLIAEERTAEFCTKKKKMKKTTLEKFSVSAIADRIGAVGFIRSAVGRFVCPIAICKSDLSLPDYQPPGANRN